MNNPWKPFTSLDDLPDLCLVVLESTNSSYLTSYKVFNRKKSWVATIGDHFSWDHLTHGTKIVAWQDIQPYSPEAEQPESDEYMEAWEFLYNITHKSLVDKGDAYFSGTSYSREYDTDLYMYQVDLGPTAFVRFDYNEELRCIVDLDTYDDDGTFACAPTHNAIGYSLELIREIAAAYNPQTDTIDIGVGDSCTFDENKYLVYEAQ